MGLGEVFAYFNQACLLATVCVCACVFQTYLYDVPVGHHLGQTLSDLGTGRAEQHHHASRGLCVYGMKEAIDAYTRITLGERERSEKNKIERMQRKDTAEEKERE